MIYWRKTWVIIAVESIFLHKQLHDVFCAGNIVSKIEEGTIVNQ